MISEGSCDTEDVITEINYIKSIFKDFYKKNIIFLYLTILLYFWSDKCLGDAAETSLKNYDVGFYTLYVLSLCNVSSHVSPQSKLNMAT